MRQPFDQALRLLAALVTLALASATPADAASIVSGPSGPVVDAGKTTVEVRAGAFENDGTSTIRLRKHIDHAFNDRLALRFTHVQEDSEDGGLHPYSTAVDLRLQLFEHDRDGFDGGVRVNYTFGVADGEPETVDVRLLAEGETKNDWRWRGNILVKQKIGAVSLDADPALELRGSLSREAPSPVDFASLHLGVEAFADLGEIGDFSDYDDQDNQIGLTARFTTKSDAYLQINVRAGLSEAAPDHAVSLFLAKSF